MKHLPDLKFISISHIFWLFWLFSPTVFAQDLEAKIKIVAPNKISVEGKFLSKNSDPASKDISFLQSIADVSNIANRVENFRAFSQNLAPIEAKKLIAGEYQTKENPHSWQYQVNAEVPAKLTDVAHISWLSSDLGVVMLGDLLPRFNQKVSAQVVFELPDGWKISSSETQINERVFNVKNIENAIFLVGKSFREKTIQIDKSTLSFASIGDFQFSDDEALAMANSILTEYKNIFKEIPNQKINIILLPFPQENPNSDRWRAETRGSTVTIMSGGSPFKTQAIQRLHEQLRHEIFHLWMPNGLALSGNYDWFYEGFAIYQALRTGVALNQIRFEDFLQTLGRAFEMANILSESQQISLLEATDKRWAGTGNLVYAKGLVVAFLCEVAILEQSRGKRNLKDAFRQIYQKHKFPNQIQDGNSAIVNSLKSFPELNLIVQNYVEGKSKIDWRNELKTVGLESEKDGFKTLLKVTAQPTGRQKDLLDKLGYNNWRKLLQKTK